MTDSPAAAREAGLRYTSDDSPGFTRHRAGRGFFYRDTDGHRITDKAVIRRIKSLAIPPAWTSVWIAPWENAHIQASGRDAKGRKQYRYHPRWRETRDEAKFVHTIAFAKALPVIRDRVDADMRKHGLPREKVLATIVRLLETTLIRVGNEEYAKTNKSYGLSTMKTRHANVSGNTITFAFKGKSSVEHEIDISDRRLARIVRQIQELPGQALFQYIDENGARQSVESADVNAYLREISGGDFTAKDFRTWAGTKLMAEALAAFEDVDTQTAARSNIVNAVQAVSARLGNTPTVCRKCYVHPAIIDAYLDGHTVRTMAERAKEELAESLDELPPEEAAVLMLLHQRLASGQVATT